MNAALGQLETTSLTTLFGLLPGDVRAAAVCDREHRLAWHSDGADTAACTEAARRHDLAEAPGVHQDGVDTWLTATVHDFGGEAAGTLVLLGDPETAGDDPAGPVDTLRLLASWVEHDFQLNAELNQMAAELGERYDELNLVYRANDFSEGAEGESGLIALVRNARDYMSLDGACLHVPGRDIEITEVAPGTDEARVLAILERIQARPEHYDQPLVLNGNGDSHGLASGDALVIIAPVADGKHSITGHMAAVRLSGEDFVNSDRSLVEVVAKRAARVIHNQYDALTGVLNRAAFERALERGFQTCSRDAQEHCLITVDMDRMKVVNDVFEHAGGDAVIRHVGRLIRRNVRRGDQVARLGGDNFAVLLERCPLEVGIEVAEKLRKHIHAHPVPLPNGEEVRVSASLGVAAMTARSPSASAVLDLAELARDDAKERGRDRVRVFHDEATDLQAKQLQMRWLARLQDALREDTFELFSQIITPTNEPERAHHYEVLLRMRDGNGSWWSPGEFLPAAERFQMMPLVDQWVVTNTLKTLERHARTLLGRRVSWAINLSGQSIGDEDFRRFLLDAVRSSKVPNRYIGFEVTETAAINNLTEARTFIEAIRALGCKVYLDDFGTGVSSYEYLKALPVDYVKIDGVFIKEIIDDPVAAVMVESVNQVAHVMGISTIGEFVKDAETRERLAEIGVDLAQGFALGRPEPLEGQLEDL